jgi:hypothetical protein
MVYFTPEVAAAIKEKKKLFYRSKNPNWKLDTVRYNTCCKKVKSSIFRATVNYEKELAFKSKKNPKLIYQYINKKQKVKDNIKSMHDSSGAVTTDQQNIVAILNNFFESVFTKPSNDANPFPVFERRTEAVLTETSIISTITTPRIRLLLSELDTTKSAGPDSIHPYILNKCSASICTPLTSIFIKSIKEGTIPDAWTVANVTPLHKKGSRLDASNYRPISLTSIACKLFERIVKDCILHHLTTNDLIAHQQHGFVPEKSCITNLLETVDLVSREMANGFSIDSLYLDYEKAFDKPPHDLMIYKLEA